MNVPDNYKVIFVQGGASTMFASNVLNLCQPGRKSGLRDDWCVVGEARPRRRYGDAGEAANIKVIFQPFRTGARGI